MDKLTYIAIPGSTRFPGVFAVPTRNRDEGAVAKAAGLWFHGPGACRPNCPACAAKLPKFGQGPYGSPAWWFMPADEAGRAKAARLAHHADEAATVELARTVASLEASRATDCTDRELVCAPDRSYLGYQRAGIAYCLSRKGVLLADEMGLGKTVQAIGAFVNDPAAKTMLIVCPASLRINWIRELCKWLVRAEKLHMVDAEGAKAPKGLDLGAHTLSIGPVPPADATVVVVNYDRVRKPDTSIALTMRRWDVLAVDEAHFLKNPKAQRTIAVLGAAARRGEAAKPGLRTVSDRFLALTGTPLPNKPVEMWPLLNALDPQTFGNFFGYAKRYCDAHQETVARGKTVWVFDGASHLDELQDKLRATVMVRRLKADVLKELPAKVRETVVLPCEGKAARIVAREMAQYETAEFDIESARVDAYLAEASGDYDGYYEAVERVGAAQRVAFEEMSAVRHEVALAKLPLVVEHVQGMLEGGVEKVVVFAHHRDVADGLRDAFAAQGAVMVIGGVANADRDAAVQRFQNDPTCKVFVGNILAAGVGLTLTAAHHVVMAELDWVPGNVTQAEDRCHRIGQLDTVFVQHLVFDGSLDERMAAVLVAKQNVADSALDRQRAQLVIPADRPARVAPSTAGAAAPAASDASPRARELQLTVGRHLRAERPDVYPQYSGETRALAKQAMQTVAGMCDGALKDDGVGFSKIDAYAGAKLARVARDYTDGECWFALVLARRYRGQLSAALVAALDVGAKPAKSAAAA